MPSTETSAINICNDRDLLKTSSKLSKAKDRVLNRNVFAEYRAERALRQSSRMESILDERQDRAVDNGQQGMSDPEDSDSDGPLLPGEMSAKEVAHLFDKGMSETRLWKMQIARYRRERMRKYSECVRTRAELSPETAGSASKKVIAATGVGELSIVDEERRKRKVKLHRQCCADAMRASSVQQPTPRSGGNTPRQIIDIENKRNSHAEKREKLSPYRTRLDTAYRRRSRQQSHLNMLS